MLSNRDIALTWQFPLTFVGSMQNISTIVDHAKLQMLREHLSILGGERELSAPARESGLSSWRSIWNLFSIQEENSTSAKSRPNALNRVEEARIKQFRLPHVPRLVWRGVNNPWKYPRLHPTSRNLKPSSPSSNSLTSTQKTPPFLYYIKYSIWHPL